MAHKQPTDEQLMAYADGAMAPEEAARLAPLIAADQDLQDKVEMFRQTGELVREARGVFEADPVPDRLRQSIETMIAAAGPASAASNVVSFGKRKPVAALMTSRPWAMPIAASLIAVLGGIGGYFIDHAPAGGDSSGFAAIGGMLPPEIGDTLKTLASGSEVDVASGHVRLIATMRTKGGELCREFEIDKATGLTVVGVGCRDGQGWRLDIAVAAPKSESGFAPASSLNAIESYLGMVEAGEPLPPEDEAAALARAG